MWVLIYSYLIFLYMKHYNSNSSMGKSFNYNHATPTYTEEQKVQAIQLAS